MRHHSQHRMVLSMLANPFRLMKTWNIKLQIEIKRFFISNNLCHTKNASKKIKDLPDACWLIVVDCSPEVDGLCLNSSSWYVSNIININKILRKPRHSSLFSLLSYLHYKSLAIRKNNQWLAIANMFLQIAFVPFIVSW